MKLPRTLGEYMRRCKSWHMQSVTLASVVVLARQNVLYPRSARAKSITRLMRIAASSVELAQEYVRSVLRLRQRSN